MDIPLQLLYVDLPLPRSSLEDPSIGRVVNGFDGRVCSQVKLLGSLILIVLNIS